MKFNFFFLTHFCCFSYIRYDLWKKVESKNSWPTVMLHKPFKCSRSVPYGKREKIDSDMQRSGVFFPLIFSFYTGWLSLFCCHDKLPTNPGFLAIHTFWLEYKVFFLSVLIHPLFIAIHQSQSMNEISYVFVCVFEDDESRWVNELMNKIKMKWNEFEYADGMPNALDQNVNWVKILINQSWFEWGIADWCLI